MPGMSSDARTKLAILDDYQGVALEHGDWGALKGRVDITVFRDHLADEDALAGRLEPFQAIVSVEVPLKLGFDV